MGRRRRRGDTRKVGYIWKRRRRLKTRMKSMRRKKGGDGDELREGEEGGEGVAGRG